MGPDKALMTLDKYQNIYIRLASTKKFKIKKKEKEAEKQVKRSSKKSKKPKRRSYLYDHFGLRNKKTCHSKQITCQKPFQD